MLIVVQTLFNIFGANLEDGSQRLILSTNTLLFRVNKRKVIYIYLVNIVLFVLPTVAVLLGGLGYFIFKNLYIVPLFVLIAASISVYTVFNSSFWIWVVIYTLASLLAGLFVKLFFSKRKISNT
ncbi:DUF2651 family protein [Guptibacillus hwajinpoensis]|uniref:DUF2651 family protein n=1 Tax=Guptibacillus hwajinpoensis TaxID=208199 RepID=UPI003D16233F